MPNVQTNVHCIGNKTKTAEDNSRNVRMHQTEVQVKNSLICMTSSDTSLLVDGDKLALETLMYTHQELHQLWRLAPQIKGLPLERWRAETR